MSRLPVALKRGTVGGVQHAGALASSAYSAVADYTCATCRCCSPGAVSPDRYHSRMVIRGGLQQVRTQELIALADELIDLMGADWLEERLAHPSREKHTVAAWLCQYKRGEPDPLHPSQQLLQIAELAMHIRVLRDSGTQNLMARVDDLRLDDEERVKSAIHEIRAASGYVMSGGRVVFIPETSTKTPDFIVDDRVEVECKRRAGTSARDRGRLELYKLLERKLVSVFPEHIDHSALAVEVMFKVEPRREFVGRIVESARQGLRKPQPSSFSDIAPGLFTANFEVVGAEANADTNTGVAELFLPMPSTGEADEFDWRSTGGTVDQNFGIARVLTLNAGCKVRQDCVKGTVKSVKKAARQFSGRNPAVVSLDISSIPAREGTEELAHLNSDIRSLLKSNTTISRVDLTITGFSGEPGDQIYGTRVTEMIINPDAALPVPSRSG